MPCSGPRPIRPSPQFRSDMIAPLFKYAHFQYECGNYAGAADHLHFYKAVVSGWARTGAGLRG